MIEKTIEGIVHNRFDVEVRDARTGELKQEAKGYNVVLDKFFSNLFSNGTDRLGFIAIGKGTGIPSTSDTGFFSLVGFKNAEIVEKNKAYPTSYVKKKIVLEPSDFIGVAITEVGFFYPYYDTFTKAMLKDSEGNNISILKTATDIITIYATFYFTFNNVAEGCVFPKNPSNNAIINTIIDDGGMGYEVSYTRCSSLMYLSALNFMNYEDEREKGLLLGISSGSGRGSLTTMKHTFPKSRFNYNYGNGYLIEGIGVKGYAFWKLPNSKILPNIPLTNLGIGTGDGVKNKFVSPIPRIVKNSETIKVNNVVQEKERDYIFKYDVNGAMWPQYFESSGDVILNPDDSGYSHFGRPFGLIKYGSAYYFGEYTLDFKETKRINTIKILPNVLDSYSSSTKLILSYSIDNINWVEVISETTSSVKVGFVQVLEESIEARYWKLNGTSSNYFVSNPNIMIGYTEPEITFTTPPPQDAVITMDCQIDRPLKNENWVIDFGFSIQFQRG